MYRQEFGNPRLFWNKVSFGWWLIKQGVKLALSLVKTGILRYFDKASKLGYTIPAEIAKKLTEYGIGVIFDPIEGFILDKNGNVLGWSNGTMVNQMSTSIFVASRNTTEELYDCFIILDNETEDYSYSVQGWTDQNCTMSISLGDLEGHEITFNANEIPIHVGERHKYAVNWTSLELGLPGVQVSVDVDGDGLCEHCFTSSSELTADEFRRRVLPGDINEDGIVDIFDAILLANAYNSSPGHPVWNQKADINVDDIIDIYDAIILATHYNQHYP